MPGIIEQRLVVQEIEADQDHRDVVEHDAQGVAGKPLVRVQNADHEPGQAHEQGLEKHDPGQVGGQGDSIGVETRRQDVYELGSVEFSEGDHHHQDQEDHVEQAAGHVPALFLLPPGQVAAEDRDEGGGQGAPYQYIIGEVRHREGGLVAVGNPSHPEQGVKHGVPHVSQDA